MTHPPADHTRSPGPPPDAAPFPERAGDAGRDPGRSGWLLALLAALACCGLPLLILGGAVVGWAGVGWIDGGIAAAAVAAASLLWLSRCRAEACCPLARQPHRSW